MDQPSIASDPAVQSNGRSTSSKALYRLHEDVPCTAPCLQPVQPLRKQHLHVVNLDLCRSDWWGTRSLWYRQLFVHRVSRTPLQLSSRMLVVSRLTNVHFTGQRTRLEGRSSYTTHVSHIIPDYVVHADTVNCFKRRLDTFWSNQNLVYNFKAEISGTGSRSEVV